MKKRVSKADLLARNSVFRALCNVPMAKGAQVAVSVDLRLAFEKARGGIAVKADRDLLAVFSNVTMILADTHLDDSDLQICIDAQDALQRADERAANGHNWGLDGKGLSQVREMVELHEQVIEVLGKGVVAGALIEVQQRMKGEVKV